MNCEAKTMVLEGRPLTEKEQAVAQWLLLYGSNPEPAFLTQLREARVTGRCECGCPSVNLQVAEDTQPLLGRTNPVGNSVGDVNGNQVGVMLLQREGFLVYLEAYDLSDIEHPYDLPEVTSLRPFSTA